MHTCAHTTDNKNNNTLVYPAVCIDFDSFGFKSSADVTVVGVSGPVRPSAE